MEAVEGKVIESAVYSDDVSLDEIVALAGEDGDFYSRYFFPKTVRQESPDFHKEIDLALDGPERYVAFEIFRGGAKTTRFRLFISKRIAYGISRTILIVGKSQDHARRTVEWLMTQVETNRRWAQTFGLRKGKKWTGEEIEIFHGVDEIPIRVIALGITGSTRGIVVDDYRPDLIGIDDPCDEENTATVEQRTKTNDLLFGSLYNSLAPRSEAPEAKMVLMQTLLNGDDAISMCKRDPLWLTLSFSIYKEDGTPQWPARWTKEELDAEKAGFTARGKLHLWMREMENTLISGDMRVFNMDQLTYFTVLPDDSELTYYMGIDPVPPPSEKEIAQGLIHKDHEVLAVTAKWKNRHFVVEYAKNKGHTPEWTLGEFFRLLAKYPIRKIRVESIAYQRTLKWLIETAMKRRRMWRQIDDTSSNAKQKKTYRIIDTIGNVVADKRLAIRADMVDFVDQYRDFPVVKHDDVIDAVSIAIHAAESDSTIAGEYDIIEDEKNYPDLDMAEMCP